MQYTEIEVKFAIDDPSAMRRRILGIGAQSKGKVFEANVRYDDPQGSLRHSKSLLRLRRDRKVTLTYKALPETADPQFKILKELEVTVDDFKTMHLILEALGFQKVQVYEKWRESFRCENATLCLDTMPFGTFLEIEGPRKAIRSFARRLELPWPSRILSNYLELFADLQKEYNLPFKDVTFANFEQAGFRPVDGHGKSSG